MIAYHRCTVCGFIVPFDPEADTNNPLDCLNTVIAMGLHMQKCGTLTLPPSQAWSLVAEVAQA
jgi:hypothetical protein